ncbi:Myosin-3 [Caenorhabditis elegans]|uniref:Myosin-3 n=1 Tax=Caenorhabditis elegans TaxID=6239 RepID=MYO3_CAEEL|nr:Myosin-3 [Caenorhabditis elegans]P12844.1 RecName: Full=Myosin-3; AltName: Full=Myosin heavy chain A; Short=MHC A [Caenorhabditis elegans]CAA30856.1 myosin heavy chain 3 [Caenorhabditis elegans]CAB01576.2 Myosin-3 [Caenorhabditis elegans]|eukprot:NP_506065.2 Myosin-3 [Caenorhabditis elegans]
MSGNPDAFENDPGFPFLGISREARAATAARPFDSKKNCWIPDPEDGFVAAEIQSTTGEQVTVVTVKGNQITVKKDQCQEMNPPKFDKTEDMANLTFLNEASVLGNLKDRYKDLMIYTYSGLFCVVINPYKRLPIYSESVIKHFMGKRRNEMPPHLFAVSDEAYRNMVQDKENQSMLITGESGAGKTENTKKVISYFAIVGATQAASGKEAKDGKKGGTLEEQIVQTNPVLEAFGNAKTVRNNNSSRFGKFIRTHFSGSGKLAGGDIEHYLLEKSRVVRQAPGERCYHIFYQIMSGNDPSLRGKLKLSNDITYYHFCSQAELTIEGMDDKEEMRLTQEAFDIMGFEDNETMDLYRSTAGIMHMGEMKFKQRPREEQAEPDGEEDALNAAAMLGIQAEEFLKALTKPRVRVGTEWVNKGQNLEQVNWAVSGLAKAIYARMFKWIITRCNKTLDAKEIERKHFIGVLDIAGFEIFDLNSFEQLWINFVNERLQQFFNHHMFVLEQEEYKREGIAWTFIDFGLDLQACIELIEKPLGIISILDEECIVPKATDMTYAQKLLDQHLGKHPNFQKPKPPKGKQGDAHFAIVHYAGTVRYNATNFLEKNKDPLNDTAVALLKHSTDNSLMLDIWQDYQTQEEAAEAAKAGQTAGGKRGKSSSFATVSMIYRESLNNLMNMLYQTHPHFIRCIIPNEKKASGVIDSALVLNQLTCNGVLEGIRICRKGFPNRMLYPDFKHRYAILAADAAKESDPKKASVGILDKISVDGNLTDEEFKVGETKIFFKAGVLAKLEDLRDEILSRIVTMFQSRIRSYLAKAEVRRRYEQQTGLLVVQRNVRAWCTLRTWEWFKLFGKVKPMLKAGKEQEAMGELAVKIQKLEEAVQRGEIARSQLESQVADLVEEKNALFLSLETEKANLADAEERNEKLNQLKATLESKLSDITGQLEDMQERNEDLARQKKKTDQELSDTKKHVQDLELSLRKAEQEKQSRDHNIRSLQDEMANQDEAVAKLNKEKKHQEESNRKLNEDLQSEEDKVNHLEKIRNKLEQQMDELEENIDREKRSRGDIEKAKRKVEGDLKVAQENIDEITKQKHDVETTLKRKEEDLHHTNAKLAENNSIIAKLQRLIKELTARNAELEEELEAERNSRQKSDRSRSEAERELEELTERLEQQGGATAAQLEANKKREAEIAKLRREKEEDSLNHETAISSLRKRHGDSVAELTEQLETLQKLKAKSEAEKSKLQRDLEESQHATDSEVRSRQDLEKALKTIEVQYSELQTKADEQSRQLQDFAALKNRLNNENSDLNRSLEEMDNQLNSLHRLKSTLQSQLDETRRNYDEESRERQALAATAKNLEHENTILREHLDEEAESKADLTRQISKLNAEIQQWKARFDSEGLNKLEEIEAAKKALQLKVQELTDTNEGLFAKIASQEKVRFKLMQDLDDAQSDVEKAAAQVAFYEKHRRQFESIIAEWKKKTDDLSSELDAAQRDNRQLSTDLFKAKTANDELAEYLDSTRRENKSLAQEVKDLTDQLGEGGRSVAELQKIVRKLEVEKEELQKALDEAEAALEAEEAKVLRAQIEVSQIRSEIEKRIQEKEEEFENTRRNHQRALESMQATLEAETKQKEEALRIKKKLESDINDLEIALDHANRAYADAQKTIKKYMETVQELQFQIEEEQRQKDEIREQFLASEKRNAILQSEKDELAQQAEAAERARRNAEAECIELREQNNDLNAHVSALTGQRRKLEGELLAAHAELEEIANELKNAVEQGQKASADAARLAEELRQEQEHSMHIERIRKGLELQIKEMQIRLDDAENAALKGGKKIIAQLEARIRAIEQELDGEQRRHQDTEKNWRKAERRVKEVEFQVVEEKKNEERLTELVDKLQCKLKIFKRQVEEAEEVAASNLNKYKVLTAQFEQAEERADIAENALSKMRNKIRASASMAPPDGFPMVPSASSALIRSSSNARFL